MIAAAGRTFPAARLSIYQARNTTFHPKYNCKTQQYRTWIQHMKRTWNMQEDQETNVQTTSITFSHVRTEQSRSADLHRAHDRKIHRFQITHDPADSGRLWPAADAARPKAAVAISGPQSSAELRGVVALAMAGHVHQRW